MPPYIKRVAYKNDEERYQTVYANEAKENSVAAPTAGLHFTKTQLQEIEKKGVEVVYITLDIGLGTFEPIRIDNFEHHVMHSETITINEETANKINKVLCSDSKIIAVGLRLLVVVR